MLHVDIKGVVAARLGNHCDIDRTREAEIHAEHEVAGGESVPHRFIGHAFLLRCGHTAGLQHLEDRDTRDVDEDASVVLRLRLY